MHGILSRGITVPAIGRKRRDRRQILPPRAPFFSFLGLAVLAGYLAANLTGELMRPSSLVTAGNATPSVHTTAAKSDALGNLIAAAHLFGTSTSRSQTALTNAPETHLNLTLVGIAAGLKRNSRAIIASGPSGLEKTYAVGASLPDGAVIRAILARQVVLDHNGHLESLRLPNPGTSILATHMTFSSTPSVHSPHNSDSQQGNSLLPAQLSTVRTRIESHPKDAYKYIRMQRYAPKGKLEGFRVYPGKDPMFFEQSGLRSGEIVTGIGGISLSSPVDIAKALNKLRKSHSTITLQVLRNGHPSTVQINTGG